MSPDLRLRLHATQAQPCFPAASNALALPGGNGIFTATPTERITHYTLLRKVVCQMGALPPLETPTRKGGTLPLHGAHTAFSCYPALRLYRLSKSPRGIDVVSLTLGNSRGGSGNILGGLVDNTNKNQNTSAEQKTIEYYNSKAEEFYESTVNADMSDQYYLFEKYLGDGTHILDCGCGSGRDSKHFLENGFKVTAIDGSEELCKKASELTGLEVKHMYFQDLNFDNDFDGVWACASLLHVEKDRLPDVLKKITRVLKGGGVLYASFKYGDFSGERNGRFFTDLDDKSFETLIADIPELVLKEKYISTDVRPGRENDRWLNAIVIKRKELGHKSRC